MELCDTMLCHGIKPNIVSYNALITACEKGTRPEFALDILQARDGRDPLDTGKPGKPGNRYKNHQKTELATLPQNAPKTLPKRSNPPK